MLYANKGGELAGRRRRGSGYELRDEIVRAATGLLAELGNVDALTMRAVAAAAGVTPPSVYRHFQDKASLVKTVITTHFDEFAEALQAPSAPDGDAATPLAHLEAMARAYVAWALARPGHYRVLFSATNAGPIGLGLDDDTEHPGAPTFRALVSAVSACLPAGAGEAAVFTTATELWASLHGIVDLRITKPEIPWPDPPTLIDHALAAVRAQQQSPT